jgi:putative addiction module component (TIGR02574 family)
MSSYQEVLAAARSLSTTDQAQLAAAIWEEMDPENWPLPTEEWIAEAQRRSAEYDADEMTASPWSEVRLRSRQKAGLDG